MGRTVVAAIVSFWVISVSLIVNLVVTEPYMDEIFHIPQAQHYCKGNFKIWDPMITTPPGLYYLSLLQISSLFPATFYAKSVSSFSELCSTATLRSANGVLAVISGLLVYEIITELRPALNERKATLHAVVLSLYPFHWFFAYLYYTDVASVAMVLAMHLACLRRRFLLSAVLGALAIFIRQTNVVWMVLVASTGILNYILPSNCKEKARSDDCYVSNKTRDVVIDKKSMAMDSNLRKRKPGISSLDAINFMSEASASPLDSTAGLLYEVRVILARVWLLKWEVLESFGPFLMVLLAFVAFVCWNGSIVLGAKEAHIVSPHFAQMMYFGLVSVLAIAPFSFSFSQVAVLVRSLWKNKLLSFLQILTGLVIGFISVHVFSVEHPYLLADNRHYTFYLWRKVIKRNWLTKYLLIPLYIYSWLSIFSILGKVQRRVWVVIYFLATAAVLIPAPLIEFRYYTIPFYFFILHSEINNNRSWLLMGSIYVVINVFTMTMFLLRPFHWDHEPGTQRFIW